MLYVNAYGLGWKVDERRGGDSSRLLGHSGSPLRKARGVTAARVGEPVSVRVLVRTFSELCITVGTLIVLFVVYVLFWTGVKADNAMDGQIDELQDQWARGAVSTGADGKPTETAPAEPAGPAGARRRNRPPTRTARPSPSCTSRASVSRGTSPSSRAPAPTSSRRASATTPRTARLGQKRQLRRRRPPPHLRRPLQGLPEAAPRRPRGPDRRHHLVHVPHRQEALPTLPGDIGVIDPVPRKSGYNGPGRYLTLTTCEPEWGHSHRLIAWAHLDATQPVEAGKPDGICAV